jgi:hypothetical protein
LTGRPARVDHDLTGGAITASGAGIKYGTDAFSAMKYRIEVDDAQITNMARAKFDIVPREPGARRRIAAA